jgi:hypothetical protein
LQAAGWAACCVVPEGFSEQWAANGWSFAAFKPGFSKEDLEQR